MIIRKPSDIPSSEITSQSAWLRRRDFLGAAAGAAALAMVPGTAGALAAGDSLKYRPAATDPGTGFHTPEALTPYADVASYNNFYEFGADKGDPARYAGELSTDPWTLRVDGAVEKPGKLNLEDIQAGFDLEERIYRLRCVEAWSMVVPWVGYSLASLLQRFQPTSRANYVKFYTLEDKTQMRGQRGCIRRFFIGDLRMANRADAALAGDIRRKI